MAITREQAGYLFASYNNVSTDLVNQFLDLVFGTGGQGIYLKLDGSTPMAGTINMAGNQIQNVGQLKLDINAMITSISSDMIIRNLVSGKAINISTNAGDINISPGNILNLNSAVTKVGAAGGELSFFGSPTNPRGDIDGAAFAVSVDAAVIQLQGLVGQLRDALGTASGYGLLNTV